MRVMFLLIISLFVLSWSNPASITDRALYTPDYYQRDTTFGAFPGSGAMYCGPVAVSNSIMWLSNNGFSSLVPSLDNQAREQHSLIALLGSADFMNTREIGSTVQDLCRGVQKYLQLYNLSGQIESEGMYKVSKEFRSDRTVPDLNRIKAFTKGKTAAWLNVGWYKYDAEKDTYTKNGGHWVTLVGFYRDHKSGKDFLIIHDPDTVGPASESISIEEISSGTIINGPDVSARSAAGYLSFKTESKNLGIIGGVVYLSLENIDPQNQVASK